MEEFGGERLPSCAEEPASFEDQMPELERLTCVASETAEALRRECERGLTRVKFLMAYMACVSMMILPCVTIIEFILIYSQKGNLEKDWWKCLIHGNVLAHWIESTQSTQLPTVLGALLVQSCLLAWASIIAYQRACIRMDWIASAVVNCSFSLLLILLPQGNASTPAPQSITVSLVTFAGFAWKPHRFSQVPEPNRCPRAQQFLVLCTWLTVAVTVANVVCLFSSIRAEMIRRRAIAAEKALCRATGEKSKLGLAHRLCNDGLPRSIVAGGTMYFAYIIMAITRSIMLVYGQHSFDNLLRQRSFKGVTFLGGIVLIGQAPSTALGPTLAVLAFSQIIRGYSGDDLASYRVAAFMCFGSLFVTIPSFAGLMQSVIWHRLWDITSDTCLNVVSDTSRKFYGFPTRKVARVQCYLKFIDFYATCVFVLFLFCMGTSAMRTFALNDHSLDDIITPAPTDRAVHMLHTTDNTGFENDLMGRPTIRRASSLNDGNYAAIIIRQSTVGSSRSSAVERHHHHLIRRNTSPAQNNKPRTAASSPVRREPALSF